MASLYENYEKIERTIGKIKESIRLKREEIRSISGRRTDEIPLRIENLEEHLKKIDEYQLKIEAIRRQAEKNLTSKNALTIEAPPGYRVNLNRLKSWAMMIDPQNEDDPYAQRVYLVAKCDAYFLEQKKAEFEARIVELKADLENGSVDEIKALEKEIESLQEKLGRYVNSEEVAEFAKQVRRENEHYMYSEAPEKYTVKSADEEGLVIGSVGYALDAGPACNKRLKELFGSFYREEQAKVYLPAEPIGADTEFAMTISCVPARKRLNEMDAGVRALLFNIIDHSGTGLRKVYIIDGERQNSALVGSLKVLEDSAFLNAVPRNAEMITSTLEQIVASFSDIDEMLENYDTVIEYNRAVPQEKRIRRNVIVIVGYPDAFEGENRNYIKKILTNYERYGISFIACQITAKKEEKDSPLKISEYVGEDMIDIRMTTGESTVRTGQTKETLFQWYPFRHVLKDDYVAFVRNYKADGGQKGTEYIKRVDMENIPPYVRGRKNIDVPYGVDSKDEVHSISFENENFAAYLMGASGSGKSTLLHTIITGIIRNFHPDDVELWLADFKMSEFAQYMNPLPPHVRYILLDESRELVYDLLDRLTEKMMERQRFFMQHRDLKKVENVPSNIYMPVIFVILDEFSIMSQAVAENESYKLKLQNLLAKGRALGIKFIFSSQTFTRGIAGLTATAKEQIQARIAMKNSTDEISNTLELSAASKTEQVKAWMDALPPHYALIKYRKEDRVFVNRLRVMYFPGSGAEALLPQQRLIRQLNDSMTEVSMDRYHEGINTYVKKNPVIVDGNSYKAYDKEAVAHAKKEFLESGESGFAEDIFISPGDPRRMVNYKFIAVSEETRENILLVGRGAEGACVMSVIMSVSRQFEEQGGEVHIWAYARNRLYHEYREAQFGGMDVYEGAEEVSVQIGRLKEKISAGETGKDLVIMLGMEQLCGDFEVMGGRKGTTSAPLARMPKKIEIKVDDRLAAKSREEIEEVARMHETYQDLDAYLSEKEDELIEKGLSFEEMEEELAKLEAEFYKKQAAAGQDGGETPEETEAEGREEGNGDKADGQGTESSEEAKDTRAAAETYGNRPEEIHAETTVSGNQTEAGDEETAQNAEKEDREDRENAEKPYDASADLKEIIAKGSRYGYHFMLCLNSIADIKATKTDVRLYNHKLAFQVSGDDSVLIYGNKAAAGLPEHICQYSNGMEQFSFRPYLHKGIVWDGWDVDEDGNVMDPSMF